MEESSSKISYPFLDVFPFCGGLSCCCGGLSQSQVKEIVIAKEARTLDASVWFPQQPSGAEIKALSERIAAEYRLESVRISPEYPQPKVELPPETKGGKGGKKDKGKLLMGKTIKGSLTALSMLNAESGLVVVEGKVFFSENREVRTGAVLNFAITDYTGSLTVSQFIKKGDDATILDKVHVGQWLRIKGVVAMNRYEGDITMTPQSIEEIDHEERQDAYEGEKRVELHLHTRYSALDALTDPTAAVKTAARWGHKAIAITDHGVAQAFPEIWNAGKKNHIRIIYGVEGYFVNDVDDMLTVNGETELPIDCDFVAFDIETTGLDGERDHITEIGAALFSGGKVQKTFQTFVNPGIPIPAEVVTLTGITDKDVADAPSESDAVADFIAFAGDCPLVAHNAQFDVGFITRVAAQSGRVYDPVFADTLPLAQCLLPTLKRHKLDTVARALDLPDFNHHRASDDASVAGYIYAALLEKLREKGAERLSDVEVICRRERQNAGNRHTRHIILLVKDKVGLKNLYELISKSHLENFHKNPIIPKSLLMQYREGIIIGSACEAGEIFDAVLRKRSAAELHRLADFYDFLEIQPICNNRFLLEEGKVQSEEELRDLNRRIVALAKELGKPFCATGDVHFLEPEDEIYRHILQAARKFADADKSLPIYFKTTEEMMDEFAYLGEEDCYAAVIGNPNAIAESVEDFELLPPDLYPPTIPHAAEDLERMVWDKTHELYGDDPPELIRSRIQEELDAILGRHYEVIYMSAQKLVQNSLEHGYLVGSRGSVGSSMVAYMSGITEVNSLPPHYRCPKCKFTDFENIIDEETGEKFGCGADMPDRNCSVCGTPLAKEGFDIPFETFLGFGGDKVPDIDLNFSGEYQANAHKYTEELFGRDHVFRAGTIGTLAEKTAYGYVKKYLEERGMVVSKAEENRLAAGCVGVKRTTGQHPGGLVIIPQDKDVTDFCPVQHPADDADGGIITTHFEYHSMEANLLKLDELGHDDPTMIRMMEDMTGVNAREIPLDDKATMAIFTTPAPLGLPEDDPIVGKTGTIGVPEFGTAFTRQMLVDTQPKQFNTLIRLSGFSHGTDVWAGNIRDLVVNKVAAVNDCVGCRDDIMVYLISMGMEPKRAFKFMEAVRKGAIHKGKPWPDGIVEEMQQLGVPEWWIESCRKIQYLFPKAHAAAYVMMAFRIAWFKVHEPLAYYSAYFYRRSEKDGFDAESMIQGIDTVKARIAAIRKNPAPTAKEEDLLTTLESVYEFYLRGFRFLPVSIYRSDSRRFLIEDGALRPPFVAISGLGETAAEDLKNCNKDSLVSIEDVANSCPKVSQTHLEQLRKLGAFGDLPESSQVSLFDF